MKLSQNPLRAPRGPDRVDHVVLVDREHNVLGCIDRLKKNGELIRLDGGLHWASSHSPLDERS